MYAYCSKTVAIAAAGLSLMILSEFPAIAGQVAGRALSVKPNATLANAEGSVTLVVGADIAMGDRIKTDRKGQVQLKFSDETKLVVGPNSSLVIEAYLLRSGNRANNFTVRALGGSFRMITGKSKKQAYKIKTPTATIGVRGTSFDIAVQRNGETGVLLFEGEAEICGRSGKCEVLDRRCSIAEAPRNEDVRVLKEKRNLKVQINKRFPYAVSQQSLRRDFRVRQRDCVEFARLTDPIVRQRTVRTPAPVGAAPPEPDPEPAPEPGNPGNGGPMGNAGPDPSGRGFGDPERGRSDTAPGRNKSNSTNGANNNGRGRS